MSETLCQVVQYVDGVQVDRRFAGLAVLYTNSLVFMIGAVISSHVSSFRPLHQWSEAKCHLACKRYAWRAGGMEAGMAQASPTSAHGNPWEAGRNDSAEIENIRGDGNATQRGTLKGSLYCVQTCLEELRDSQGAITSPDPFFLPGNIPKSRKTNLT